MTCQPQDHHCRPESSWRRRRWIGGICKEAKKRRLGFVSPKLLLSETADQHSPVSQLGQLNRLLYIIDSGTCSYKSKGWRETRRRPQLLYVLPFSFPSTTTPSITPTHFPSTADAADSKNQHTVPHTVGTNVFNLAIHVPSCVASTIHIDVIKMR
jgi:hypothetical protein